MTRIDGSLLKALRESKRLSQEDAAKQLGYAKIGSGVRQIGRWEAGTISPRSPQYRAYLKLLEAYDSEAIFVALTEAVTDLHRRLAVIDVKVSLIAKKLGVDEAEVAALADEVFRQLGSGSNPESGDKSRKAH